MRSVFVAALLHAAAGSSLPDRPPGGSRPPDGRRPKAAVGRTISQILEGMMARLPGEDDAVPKEMMMQRTPWELASEQHSYISQILDLNRRQHELARIRGDSTAQETRFMAQRRLAQRRAPPRVVIVSNRLPISVKRGPEGKLEFSVSSGGMVSALLGVQNMRMVWVGWCELDDATPEERQLVRRHMLRRGCVPIFLEKSIARGYYNGFCNDVLWPLFHYVSRSPDEEGSEQEGQHDQWAAYCEANSKFAETVAAVARSEDVVWVHDYHLMLLPSMLRERLPRLRIGWFLHTPWPSSEIFRTTPFRIEILRGLLGADLLGFHVYEYARHFLHACTHLLGSEVSLRARHLAWDRPLDTPQGGVARQLVRVDAFPIGIDPDRFSRGIEVPTVVARISELRRQFEGMQVLLGVDRVDYIKGIPQKLLAVETLLEAHPEYVGKVVLLQIAVPTRTEVPEYQKLRATAHRIVGRINGRFGSVGYVPIHYLDKSVAFEELCALYYISAACVVTSLRDGMNLVSYEYVACQGESKGVLVLSEFAGAAQALGAGCVRVNPYNTEELARGMHTALSMGEAQRRELHAYAHQYVTKFTAQAWAQNLVSQLQRTADAHTSSDRTTHALPLLTLTHELLGAYRNATRRLLMLCMGGTFLPGSEEKGGTSDGERDDVSLTHAQRDMLRRLLRDPANTVLLVSGRSRDRMDSLLHDVLHDVDVEDEAGAAAAVLAEADADADDGLAEGEGAGEGAGEGGAAGRKARARALELPGALWGVAEGGVFTRRYTQGAVWESTVKQEAAAPATWLEVAQEVFDYFKERTPESRVSRRECTIRWSYAAADHALGARHAALLVEHLEKVLVSAPVEMVWESTFVEVRPYGSSMAIGLLQLLETDCSARAEEGRGDSVEEGDFDWVFCMGNFTARDEDVFVKVHSLFSPASDGADTAAAEARPSIEVEELGVELAGEMGMMGSVTSSPTPSRRRLLRDIAIDGGAAEGAEEGRGAGEGVGGSHTRFESDEEAEAEAKVRAAEAGVSEAECEEGEVEAGTGVQPSGWGFTVTLGNHSTNARYFLPDKHEASRLLGMLAAEDTGDVPPVRRRERAAALLEAEAARLPNAMELAQLQIIQERLSNCWTPAFCLDYDGTLAPMVADPAAARLPKGVRKLLRRLSERHPTAIVSGRSVEKLIQWVNVRGLYFAGSHGFEITGPDGSSLNYTIAGQLLPQIRHAMRLLHERVTSQVPGAMLEDNKYALSVHTRNVSAADLPRLDELVQGVLEEQPLLRRSEGKHVIELKPQVNWNKGRAVEWLLKSMCEQLGLPSGVKDRNATAMPIYIGDDVADEDAFAELNQGRGVPIVVRKTAPLRNETAADFYLRDPRQVAEFLSLFVEDDRRMFLRPAATQEAPQPEL